MIKQRVSHSQTVSTAMFHVEHSTYVLGQLRANLPLLLSCSCTESRHCFRTGTGIILAHITANPKGRPTYTLRAHLGNPTLRNDGFLLADRKWASVPQGTLELLKAILLKSVSQTSQSRLRWAWES